MKKVLTHLAAFIGGILVTTAVGLIICEKVEEFDTDPATEDYAD